MSYYQTCRVIYVHNLLTIDIWDSTHSNTTLNILRCGGGLSKQEERVLSPCQWSKNEAVLHWDERVSWSSLEICVRSQS